MYFGYLIICPSITQNGSQWCLNNILSDCLWAKTSSTHKRNAQGKIIVSFNCLAHLQKNTANVLPQNVSPPEIHLTVLFVHEVFMQTQIMDTFWQYNFQIFFHTFTWNVLNNKVFHGQNALIRPGNHNNTLWRARQLQIVASFVNGKTTWWNLLLQAQKERPRWTMLSPFFPPRPRHRQKAQGFGILIFSQVKNWCLSSDVWEDILL